jgi:hypothetical protein
MTGVAQCIANTTLADDPAAKRFNGPPETLDQRLETIRIVHEGVSPNGDLKLFAGNDLTRLYAQPGQEIKLRRGQSDISAIGQDLMALMIDYKWAGLDEILDLLAPYKAPQDLTGVGVTFGGVRYQALLLKLAHCLNGTSLNGQAILLVV